MGLTFKKAIDDVTNYDTVNKLCKVIAEHLKVPYGRIRDAYGGYWGKKATNLPPPPPKTGNGTNGTRMLNTTNVTKKTEWVVNLYA